MLLILFGYSEMVLHSLLFTDSIFSCGKTTQTTTVK